MAEENLTRSYFRKGAIVMRDCDKERLPLAEAGEFENVEEDILGRDNVTFRCKACGQSHKSLAWFKR